MNLTMNPAMDPLRLVRLAVLVVLLLLWIPRVRKWAILHLSSRKELERVGKMAVQRLPATVNLGAVSGHEWREHRVTEEFAPALKSLGYADAGQFQVGGMEGVFVWLWVNTRDNVRGIINEHPKAGCWVELVTRYQDGSSCSASQKAATGRAHPEWLTKIQAEGAGVQQLHERMVAERPNRFHKELSVEVAARDFEEGWRKYAAWMREHTMSAEEVKAVAARRP